MLTGLPKQFINVSNNIHKQQCTSSFIIYLRNQRANYTPKLFRRSFSLHFNTHCQLKKKQIFELGTLSFNFLFSNRVVLFDFQNYGTFSNFVGGRTQLVGDRRDARVSTGGRRAVATRYSATKCKPNFGSR